MEHVDIPAGEIHTPFQWLPADSAARLAIVPNASDVHKLALQLDELSQWLLVDESPATWEQQAAQGPQGDPGPQGEPGEEGPQGPPGDPATNLVTSVAGRTGAVTLVKADVGLASVDNTADSAKPISTATQTALDGKESTISSGTTAQYWRGDKTWQDLATAVNGPAFKANKTSAQQVAPTNTNTKIAFNNEIYDSNGSYDPTNARFLPTLAGWYWIYIRKFAQITGSGTCTLDIYKNGTREIRVFYGPVTTAAAMQGGSLVYFNGSTDYVEAFASNGAGTLTMDPDTTIDEFSGRFAHP